MLQLNFMLDLQITHVINPCEQEIRFDPTKFAKQGICYKGFICKVRLVLMLVTDAELCILGHARGQHLTAP